MHPFGFYYFDYTYFLYMVPALIITMAAQIYVKSSFEKYSRISTQRSLTGAQAADAVARHGGAYGVSIQPISGNLTDNFDPRNNTISLSQNVYSSSSISAVGVAAHEAGHAVQNAVGYFPNKIRSALVPVTNIGSRLSIPIIIVGLFLPTRYSFVVYAGIILYSLVVLFQLATLPVEINASRRAVKALEETGTLYADELEGAKKVLLAAALTYVAASFAAILTLLRLLALAGNRRGRD
ncbi:MAG TPA: zinc metallopeptidase [Caproicibacter sp.]|nr:zinc metallopeptidase [Caproicibacter sp.]